MGAASTVRFPGEGKQYRDARDTLLDAEVRLRRQIEDLAALRRAMPLGGELKEDYAFEEGGIDLADRTAARPVRFSQLFEAGKDSLIIYSFMFGPAMKEACPMCTSILDGLNGQAPHLRQRANFAVVARSPIQRIREFARGRGWNHLRLLSSAGNSYNRDYHGESPDGGQMPMFNVFTRKGGKIHHFYGTELLYAPTEPGRDPCHVDLVWPLWNLLDFTPEGRGTDWYPELEYE